MPRLVTLALLSLFALALPAPAADKGKGKEVDPARKKAAEKRFAKLKDYLTERRVTHVVELLAEWGEFADATQQDDVLGWVADLREKEEGLAAALGRTAFKIGYRGVKATAEVGEKEVPSAYFVEEFCSGKPPKKRLTSDPLARQLVVASKTLVPWTNTSAEKCVILTNAAVAEFHGLDDCLVISSGSVSVTTGISMSAVVCRGNAEYTFHPNPYMGHVWAGGAVTDATPVAWDRKRPEDVGAVEKDDKLQGMKFYSAAEDGLEATAEKGVVTVSKVDEKKAFGQAGLQKGDVIETINGEKVPSLHELDRLACRATVASGVAKVKVKRGDKSEVIEVKLADW